jgi:hypothetical protein
MVMANAAGVLKKIAPWISAAATGGVPGLVNMAATTIGTALGKKVDANPGAIVEAVAGATPEQLLAIKTEDHNFELQMQKLGFDQVQHLLDAEVQDRDSARKREMQVRDHMPTILAVGAIGALIFCFCLIAFVNLPQQAEGAILTLIGFVGASYKDVYGYYFGSSKGSDDKTKLLGAASSIAK